MVILDTNVSSELMRTSPSGLVVAWIQTCPALDRATTAISLAEIHFGVERLPNGRRKDRMRQAADHVLANLAERILPFDAAAAMEYAAIVADRERAGLPIGILDSQIASICRVHNATLATRNVKDFRNTGIEVVNPWDYE